MVKQFNPCIIFGFISIIIPLRTPLQLVYPLSFMRTSFTKILPTLFSHLDIIKVTTVINWKFISSLTQEIKDACLKGVTSLKWTHADKSGQAIQRHAACWACKSRWDPVTFTWSVFNDACYRKLCLPSLCARQVSLCSPGHMSLYYYCFSSYCTYNIMPTRAMYLLLYLHH